ncbi:MAG: hypothetical protein RQ826_16365, partial [Xanthomonadales bacterium]|nr:hypothetical protein [Xanthomonadales bacterium]
MHVIKTRKPEGMGDDNGIGMAKTVSWPFLAILSGQLYSTRSTVIPAQAGIQEFRSNPQLGESSAVVGT